MDDGGPAFPALEAITNTGATRVKHGMTLRDWFAGQALIGLMSDPGMRPANLDEFNHMALRLYQVANAMVKARKDSAP